MSNFTICPFCGNSIPPAASVCAGCQAEAHRGASSADAQGAALLGIAACGGLGWFTGFHPFILSAVGGAVGAFGAGIVYSDKVTWKRIQRTR